MGMIKLSDDLILRKEYFGVLLYNFKDNTYHQYNSDGGDLLYKLRFPKKDSDIYSWVKNKSEKIRLKHFIAQCLKDGVLEKTKLNKISSALCFFMHLNRDNIRKDCLFMPTSVSLYVTGACPKQCAHCVVGARYMDQKGELTIREWKRILKNLRKDGVISVIFTGGEPLLKNGIFELLQCAENLKINYSLLTDFDGLNQAHINFLKKLRYLSYLQVSLDGASAKTQDFLRGAGSFDKAIKRLKLLAKNKIKYGISMTVHKGNFNDIDKMVSIYKKYRANTLWLNPLAPFGRGEKIRKLVLNDKELKCLGLKYLSLVKSHKIKAGNDFWVLNSELINNTDIRKFHPLKNAPMSISLGVYNFSINAFGDCHLDSKMTANNIFPLGNILNESLSDMWNKPILNKLRSLFKPEEYSYKSIRYLEKKGVFK